LPNFVDIHIDKIDETSTEGLFPDTFMVIETICQHIMWMKNDTIKYMMWN
jgi:2,3-bisphosphoglycerate-independent phosphoglycerate mutase